jgi:quinol monooxygenase YgiN
MSDLHVVAIIAAKSGSEETVRGMLTTLADATRAEEGCLSYQLFESASAPGTFITVEEWRDQADLETHLHSPHVGAAVAGSAEHLAGDIAIHPLTHV